MQMPNSEGFQIAQRVTCYNNSVVDVDATNTISLETHFANFKTSENF